MDEKKPMVSPQKKGNLKKTLTSIVAIVLVAVISVFATLAYLGTNSNDETNTFLGSAGIDLELKEEDWTKEDPDDPDKPTEEERAQDYTPGGVYLKNPTLTNNSSGSTTGLPKEWVAMKVSFEIGTKNTTEGADNKVNVDNDKSKWGVFNEIADIIYTKDGTDKKQFNTDDWFLAATSTSPNGSADGTINSSLALTANDTWAIYIYRTPLDRAATTNPLFHKVQMKEQSVFETKPDADNAYIHKDDTGKTIYNLPAFNINVIGAAIKVEEQNKGTAWDNCADKTNVMKELLGLLENK